MKFEKVVKLRSTHTQLEKLLLSSRKKDFRMDFNEWQDLHNFTVQFLAFVNRVEKRYRTPTKDVDDSELFG